MLSWLKGWVKGEGVAGSLFCMSTSSWTPFLNRFKWPGERGGGKGGREGGREGGGEGGREGGREGEREGGREGGREGEREGRREGEREKDLIRQYYQAKINEQLCIN